MVFSSTLTAILIFVSFVLFLFPIIVSCIRYLRLHIYKKESNRNIGSGLGIYVVCWLLTVALLRIVIINYSDTTGMNLFEIVITGFLQAARIMALDENYETVLECGKQMLVDYFDANQFVILLFGAFLTSMYFLSPVVGGVFVFSIITGFFPKIRLYLHFWCDQYYFSELNECSVSLAKSIAREKYGKFKKPLLIFTDTYVDEADEIDSELLQEAKRLGAICVNDDIVHLNVWSVRDKTVFLIDGNEANNIQSLAAIADKKKIKKNDNTEIFVFYQDDSYSMTELKIIDHLEKRIYEKYKESIDKRTEKLLEIALKEAEKDITPENFESVKKEKYLASFYNAVSEYEPKITRIRTYEYLTFLLLRDIPLYSPFFGKTVSDNSDFNLTIFGNGKIGMQMFLSSTWAGQIFGDKMSINIVSDESCDSFVNRVYVKYPELIETTKEDSPVLGVFSDESEKSPIYFSCRYACADLKTEQFEALKCYNVIKETDSFSILNSDYFLISLGSDETNIAVAEELIRKLIIHRSFNDTDVYVVMIIYNSVLCSLFNENGLSYLFPDSSYNKYSEKMKHIKLKAYGSCDFIYDFSNISILEYNSAALAMNNCENISKEKSTVAKSSFLRKKKIYDQWSTLARNFFINYRVYAAYEFLKENDSTNPFCVKKLEFNAKDYQNYYNVAVNKESRHPGVNNYLTWLEHRRWNAYMRSIGFSANSEKSIELKLHNCLVEAQAEPVCAYKVSSKTVYHKFCKNCKFKKVCSMTYSEKQSSGESVKKTDKLDLVGTQYKSYDNPDDYDSILEKLF